MSEQFESMGLILAGGKGTRLNCVDKNKTTLLLQGKPLIKYGVELFQDQLDEVLVVVGAFAETVIAALAEDEVSFAHQHEPKGTGHAVQVAVEQLQKDGKQPRHVFVGYGDHLMFYTPEVIRDMLHNHRQEGNSITLVTVEAEDPNALAWGRIVRDSTGNVSGIVEQKDATDEQRQIAESNAGLYCFSYAFLQDNIFALEPSPVTGEYYLTDLVKRAVDQGLRVASHSVPFELVGSGINTPDQLTESEKMMIES